MGTRADFYLGRGENAEWLGSIAFDGYPSGIPDTLTHAAETDADWRQVVADTLSRRDDATHPARGWPWPWDDSGTTDYAYAFEGGRVWASSFGHAWFAIDPEADGFGEPDGDDTPRSAVFPDMSTRKNVRYDHGSGAIFLNFPGGGR